MSTDPTPATVAASDAATKPVVSTTLNTVSVTVVPTKLSLIETALVHLWSEVSGLTVEFLETELPIFLGETGKLLQALEPLVTPIVLALVDSSLPGTEKLSTATAQVKDLAVTAGINASTTLIQTAIQFAVAKLPTASA